MADFNLYCFIRRSLFAYSIAIFLLLCGAAQAQTQTLGRSSVPANLPNDEPRQAVIIITGSHMNNAEPVGLPLDTIDEQALDRLGNPALLDLVRRLGVSSGTDGQSNQYASGWLPGTANINLRALGAGRSLVLLNGRRLSASPFPIDEQAQAFTDINQIPTNALSNIEILRHGAAAIYGSDAVGGVVNFSTLEAMEGVAISADYSGIANSNGDILVGIKGGWTFGPTSILASVSGHFRGELSVRDRNWAVQAYEDNIKGGWSGLGNPGGFIAQPNVEYAGTDASSTDYPLLYGVSDTNCAALGGTDAGGFCRFQFGQFSNLVEETQRWNVFAELRHEFSDTLHLRSEVLYADTNLPSYSTSPSFPPRFFYEQSVPADHPALVAYREANPEWADAVYADAGSDTALDQATTDLVYFGRTFGVGGNPLTGGEGSTGVRTHRMWRVLAELSGRLVEHIDWETVIAWSGAASRRTSWDVYQAGLSNALQGYGVCSDPITGMIPDGVTAGQGDCEYYNPFSTAIEKSVVTGASNPDYDADHANSLELANWMSGTLQLDASTSLLEIEAKIHGGTGWYLPGGEVGFVAGIQYRFDEYHVRPDDISNLALNPGNGEGGGVYSFFSGAYSEDRNRHIYGLYGEARTRPFKALELQLAVRVEGHNDKLLSADPKLSLQWQLTPSLATRAGIQTVFRGASLNQLGGVVTSLQYVAPTSAFKAVELHGDPDLRAERAFEFNAGFVFETNPILVSIDYWRVELNDALIVENYNEIVSAASGALDNGDTDADIVQRITFADQTAPNIAEIAAIETRIINGPFIISSGLSLRLDWQQEDLWGGKAQLGFQADYIFEFRVGPYQIEGVEIAGGDFSGQFNSTNAFRSQPRWKGRVNASYTKGPHDWQAVANLIGDYRDESSADARVDSWATLDFHYVATLSEDVKFGLHIENIFDSPPPFIAFDVNYDAFTHSPLGRVIKLGLDWAF